MIVYFIRHGATRGNIERRYVGTTDEGITQSAKILLEKKRLLSVKRVYVSPMKRCIETAYILYPGSEYIVCDDFKECDFGDFEYKNYDELKENKDYQKFIDTMGQSGFPNGESRAVFQKRCVREFEKLVSSETEDFAVVAHGGTIMAVLDEFSKPHKDYYDWQCKNTEGFSAVYENGRLTDIKEI